MNINNKKRTQKYLDYITSKEWFQKRDQAFAKYGKACQRCKTTKRLHVHHKTYIRFTFEIVETDLAILCNKCHKYFHKLVRHTTIKDTDAFIKGVAIVKRERKTKRQIKAYKQNKRDKLLQKQKEFYEKMHKSDEDELLLTEIIRGIHKE